MSADLSTELIERVRAARDARRPLNIIGGGSKTFLGRPVSNADELRITEHAGIVNYEPDELIITARAGTRLADIESALAQHQQMLPFEPPHYGANATLGGTIACNLSGPRRASAGAARDYVLGVNIINGHGERLQFGGQVMKNVAGYDVSRLVTGAYGTLGVLLEITLKVLPRPATAITLRHELSPLDAITTMNRRAGNPLPITGTAFDGAMLFTRLEGTDTAVQAARQRLGGEHSDISDFWTQVREQRHGFFADTQPLWRVSIGPTQPPLPVNGKSFMEWNGALRWLYSDDAPERILTSVQQTGGSAMLFRNGAPDGDAFQPLSPALLQIHRKLKAAFDPHGIFNPGRMYAAL